MRDIALTTRLMTKTAGRDEISNRLTNFKLIRHIKTHEYGISDVSIIMENEQEAVAASVKSEVEFFQGSVHGLWVFFT